MNMETESAPQLISVGRFVHYVLSSGRNKGEHRPATVVRVWGTPTHEHTPAVQLQVFTDSNNDFDHGQVGSNGLLWATSVAHDEHEKKPGTWHWPERV